MSAGRFHRTNGTRPQDGCSPEVEKGGCPAEFLYVHWFFYLFPRDRARAISIRGKAKNTPKHTEFILEAVPNFSCAATPKIHTNSTLKLPCSWLISCASGHAYCQQALCATTPSQLLGPEAPRVAAVKKLNLVHCGKCRGFFVKFFAAIFPGN